jgi:hypothetical protein
MTNRSWFDFQPVFPCSSRSPTGIAHALQAGPKGRALTLFPRWGSWAPRCALPSPAEQNEAQECTRARLSRAGKTVGTSSYLWVRFFLGSSRSRRGNLEKAAETPVLARIFSAQFVAGTILKMVVFYRTSVTLQAQIVNISCVLCTFRATIAQLAARSLTSVLSVMAGLDPVIHRPNVRER